MKRAGKIALCIAAGTSLGALALWWLVDHRRGTAWAVSVVRSRFPDVAQLAPGDMETWMRSSLRPPPVLIDARSSEEFAVSHLPGAIHLDVEAATERQIRELDEARPHVVYCSAGYRACRLARRLREAGIKEVYNLEGGIFAWANEGHSVQRGAETVSEVHPYHSLFSRLLKPALRHHE